MDVIPPTDVIPLNSIVSKLLAQTLQEKEFKGKNYERMPDPEVFHYSETKTGEFIIFDFKPGSEIYVLKMAEIKNCRRDKCYLSVYGADLARRVVTDVDWFVFLDDNGSKARSMASYWGNKLKHCSDVKNELWGPLFGHRKEILKFIENIVEDKSQRETHYSIVQKVPGEIICSDNLGYELKFGIKPAEGGCRIISLDEKENQALGVYDVFSYFFDVETGGHERTLSGSFRNDTPALAKDAADACFKRLMEEGK
jgi:hypothetical protein